MSSYCCGGSCSSEAGCGTGCYNVCSGDGATNAQCSTLGSGSEPGGGCSCSGNCTGKCKNSCGTNCSKNCSAENATELYQTLLKGLNPIIYAQDMQNINDMIKIQASKNRYNKTITSVNFSRDNKASQKDISTLQSNLATLGKTTEETPTVGIKIDDLVGQELIELVLDLSEKTITSASAGN